MRAPKGMILLTDHNGKPLVIRNRSIIGVESVREKPDDNTYWNSLVRTPIYSYIVRDTIQEVIKNMNRERRGK